VEHPDVVIQHAVEHCEHCHRDLSAVPPVETQCRQVFDLPHRPFEVTEHRADIKISSDCHAKTQAAFPPEVAAPVQYGPEIVARIVYTHCYQLLPIQRIVEWFRDEWQIRLSSGPVMRSLRQVADRVEPIMETVRVALQQDPHTIHADETGMRVGGKLWWFYVASNSRLTWLFAHPNRGHKAMEAALRERLRERYDALIRQGLKENPEALPAPGRRRRPKQTKTRNLLERLDRDREATLRFLDDLTVPFTNNMADRDLRMLKVRQHISGHASPDQSGCRDESPPAYFT